MFEQQNDCEWIKKGFCLFEYIYLPRIKWNLSARFGATGQNESSPPVSEVNWDFCFKCQPPGYVQVGDGLET